MASERWRGALPGGVVGNDAAAKSAPDGHTMLLAGVGPLVVAPSLYLELPYDPQRDLRPDTQLASGPLLPVVHPALNRTRKSAWVV